MSVVDCWRGRWGGQPVIAMLVIQALRLCDKLCSSGSRVEVALLSSHLEVEFIFLVLVVIYLRLLNV